MSEPSFVVRTRESYDVIAEDYARTVGADPQDRPLDRALFAAFAERVGGLGPVADVGCGPGRVTIVLRQLGLDAFGVDLSPAMVGLARRTYPDLRFEVGSMLALDLPDASLGGLLANYSIIHVPWERRPDVFAEFFRVLRPGGYCMLVFQVGDERSCRTEAYGHAISLDWYRQRPDEVSALLTGAGFEVWMRATRAPEGAEKVPQGYVMARRPPAVPPAG